MGNRRKLVFFLGSIFAIAISGAVKAQVQNTHRFVNQHSNSHNFDHQAAAQAYYRPNPSSDYGRHQATAYRDTPYAYPTASSQNRRFGSASPARSRSSFGPRRGLNRVGHGIRQDDPFGEDQGSGRINQATPRGTPFDPFADPPASNQEDHFGEEQMAPGRNGNQLSDPFADPPKQGPSTGQPRPRQPQTRQRGVDPVLPGDADPNLDARSQNGNSVLEENGEDYPPGTDKLDENQLTDPFKDPENQRNYDESRYIPPAGVYRPPGSRNRQPSYQGQYRLPPNQQQYQQPVYQPAYQPIPGQAPDYPAIYAPPEQQLVSAPAMSVLPVDSAYIPTVAPVNPCDTCQACYSGCNNGCGGACLGCDTNRCPNFYFSLFGGWTSPGALTSESGLGEFRTDDGTAFGVALGRRNGRNLRTELEFSTRSNDVTGFFDGASLTPLNGDITSYAGMANAYWEFVDVPTRFLKPYIGIGAGFISIDSGIRDANSRSILDPGTENDTSLALQCMVGINYKAYRSVDLFAEYRYLRADTLRLDTTLGTSDRYPYRSDNVFAGLRWKF